MRRVRQALLWGFIASSCVCVLLLARAGAQVATKPVTRLVGHRAIAITASGDAVLRDDGRVIGFNNRNKEAEGPIFIRGLRGIIDVAGASEDGLGPNWPKGSAYWIALRRSGEVLQWNGHCSDEGIYSCSFSRATVVPLPRKVAVIVSAGGTHLAIDSEGQAWGWGLDHDGLITGQKGERDPSGRLIPRLIERPIKIPLSAPLKYIAIGFPHSIGIDRKGTVWLWGAHNDQNFLPKDTETYTNGKFVARKVLNIPPVQSAVADGSTFVVTDTGELWSWGPVLVDRHKPSYGNRMPHKMAIPCRVKSVSSGSSMVASVCEDGAIYKMTIPGTSCLSDRNSCESSDKFNAEVRWESEQSVNNIEVLHIARFPSNAAVSMIDRSGSVYLSPSFGPGVFLPSRERLLGPVNINPERYK